MHGKSTEQSAVKLLNAPEKEKDEFVVSDN